MGEFGTQIINKQTNKLTRLPPDLHELVVRVRGRERPLVRVGQVQVVEAADEGLEPLVAPQLRRERLHQRRLPHALHAVEPDDERLPRRRLAHG